MDDSSSVEELEMDFRIAQHETNVLQYKVKRAKAMKEVKNLEDLIEKQEKIILQFKSKQSAGG